MLDLRTTAREIFQRTLAAIDVTTVVNTRLQLAGNQLVIDGEQLDLTPYRRVIVIAIGKAAVPMARAVEAILGERITDGLVVTNAVIGAPPTQLPVLIGGHPLPNAASLEAAGRAVALLREHDAPDTLVLFLLSGGGSAMFELPIAAGITLDDLQAINQKLVGCGAVISEMNIVRRYLSAVKGGRLAAASPRARQLSLYISDVNSDDLSAVASGPTLPAPATAEDFQRIIARYELLEKFPPQVAALLTANTLPALPQADTATTASRTHHLLLDNRRALAEARRIAEQDFSLVVEIADDLVEGEVEEMAQLHLERISRLRDSHPNKPVCLLSGGEVICPVRGQGQGGRNQEFVLRTALQLAARPQQNIVVLSAGTDGIDGNSSAAGALADAATIKRATEQAMAAEDYLHNSDSFNFFDRLSDAIIIGPTSNNVRDLRIFLAAS
jgi:glycerate 2-kinase